SSRTTSAVATVASSPTCNRARVAGVQCTVMPTPPTSMTAVPAPRDATRPLRNAITVLVSLLLCGVSPTARPAGGLDSAGELLAGPGEVGLGVAAPQVADGQGHRVGGVGGPGRAVQPQDPRHHDAHLGFVGAPASGDGGLDLAGRVQGDGQAAAGGADHGDGAGLRGAHDGADVVLGEDPFHGDRVGPVVVEPLLDALFDAEQPRGEFVLGGGAH